jgi:hypothetical protein
MLIVRIEYQVSTLVYLGSRSLAAAAYVVLSNEDAISPLSDTSYASNGGTR